MATDFRRLYSELGRLLENAPDLSPDGAQLLNAVKWLGKVHASVSECGLSADAARLTMETSNIGSYAWNERNVFAIAYRALAHCERRSPAAVAGTFVPAGSTFDAFAAVGKILQTAHADVLIVDPYLDEIVLTKFAHAIAEKVQLLLLADEHDVKGSLQPAASRWATQYGARRPLEVRVAAKRTLHDRAIFVDGKSAWALTQSLKDFAKRALGELVRADDTALLKIAAYEQIWNMSKVLV